MVTEIRKCEVGFCIVVNGEVVIDGFVNERAAKKSIRDAERQYSLSHNPDYLDFAAYNSAVKHIKFWLNLRSHVGETSVAEDVISVDDYNSSIAQANEKIAAYREEAEKHLPGARRWARECRIQLEEVV